MSEQDVGIPGPAQLDAPRGATSDAEFVDLIAASDWEDIELSYAALNVRYARGSLDKETRRTTLAAIRTLRDIFRDARALRGGTGRDPSPTGSE